MESENGIGVNQITSGLEGAWTTNPDKWDHQYLDLLLNYEWESKKAQQAHGSGNLLILRKKRNQLI